MKDCRWIVHTYELEKDGVWHVHKRHCSTTEALTVIRKCDGYPNMYKVITINQQW